MLIFFIASTPKLEAQGLYYDEVHQATASFAYIGQRPFQFAALTFRNLPVMNMNYSGAIKTAIYGLFLRLSGQSFSVLSWRLVGIILVCISICLSGILLRNAISPISMMLFWGLLITDISIILTTRHDWGPVALAFSMRLIFLALWIKGENTPKTSPINSFFLAFILGISLFEKLSAIVMIVPFLLMIFLSPKRRTQKHLLAGVCGGIIGGLPLILANLLSYLKKGVFISLQYSNVHTPLSISSFATYANEYLSLGAGSQVKNFILGQFTSYQKEEGILIALLFLFICASLIRSRFAYPYLLQSAILFGCYAAVLVHTYLLQQHTWVHHWVIGTPFQYAAIALFPAGFFQKTNRVSKIQNILFICLLLAILTCRLLGMISLETSLLRGDYSRIWHPSLTRIGEFAAGKSNMALFVSGDWGTANQIICYTNGQNGLVLQPDWNKDGVQYVSNAIQNSPKSEVYIIFRASSMAARYAYYQSILRDIDLALSPEWRRTQIDLELSNLAVIDSYKYQKISFP